MALMTTGTIAKAIWPGVNKFYGDGYNQYPQAFRKIFEVLKSDKSYEEDVSLSAFGQFGIKNQGSNISYDAAKQGFVTRYTHIAYALGFMATREFLEDMQYDLIFKRAKALGVSGRVTQETIAFNILNRGFNSSYTGGDGKELLSTAHPNIAGGTFSNKLAVDADFSQAALEQALIDIGGFTDDRGNKIAVREKAIIFPRQLQFEVKRVLKSDQEAGSANNDINAVKDANLQQIMSPYLDDPDAWFIQTDVMDGLKWFERRAMEFAEDNDFDTENAKYKATFRASAGWSDPRCLYGSQGA